MDNYIVGGLNRALNAICEKLEDFFAFIGMLLLLILQVYYAYWLFFVWMPGMFRREQQVKVGLISTFKQSCKRCESKPRNWEFVYLPFNCKKCVYCLDCTKTLMKSINENQDYASLKECMCADKTTLRDGFSIHGWQF